MRRFIVAGIVALGLVVPLPADHHTQPTKEARSSWSTQV